MAYMDIASGKWVVEDQFGLPDRARPLRDAVQNLMFAGAWANATAGPSRTLSVVWSRPVSTNDLLQDKDIVLGECMICCASANSCLSLMIL